VPPLINYSRIVTIKHLQVTVWMYMKRCCNHGFPAPSCISRPLIITHKINPALQLEISVVTAMKSEVDWVTSERC
jgi:hypothetical protein